MGDGTLIIGDLVFIRSNSITIIGTVNIDSDSGGNIDISGAGKDNINKIVDSSNAGLGSNAIDGRNAVRASRSIVGLDGNVSDEISTILKDFLGFKIGLDFSGRKSVPAGSDDKTGNVGDGGDSGGVLSGLGTSRSVPGAEDIAGSVGISVETDGLGGSDDISGRGDDQIDVVSVGKEQLDGIVVTLGADVSLDPDNIVDEIVRDGDLVLVDTDLDDSVSTKVDAVLDIVTLVNPVKRDLVVSVRSIFQTVIAIRVRKVAGKRRVGVSGVQARGGGNSQGGDPGTNIVEISVESNQQSGNVVREGEGGFHLESLGVGQMEGDLIDLAPVLVLLVNSNDFSEVPLGEGERVELDTDLDDVVHTVVDASLNDRVLDFSSSQEDVTRSRRLDGFGGVGTVGVVPVLLANNNIGGDGTVNPDIIFRAGGTAGRSTITVQTDLIAVAREGEVLGNSLVDNGEISLDNNTVLVGEDNLVSVGSTQSEVELFNAVNLVENIRAAGDVASNISSVSNSVGTKVKVVEERNASSDFAFRALSEATVEGQDGDDIGEVTKGGTVKIVSI